MHRSRRSVLATLAVGTATLAAPSTVTATNDQPFRGAGQDDPLSGGGGSEPDSGFRVEVDVEANGEYGWRPQTATLAHDRGVVAPCNLLETDRYGPAVELVQVTPEGSHRRVGTIGDRTASTRRHSAHSIAPGFERDYVVGGREYEFSGQVQGITPTLHRIDGDGSIQWSIQLPDLDGALEYPVPEAIARLEDVFVVVLYDHGDDDASAIVTVEPDGTVRNATRFEVDGRSAVALSDVEAVDGEAVVVGAHLPTPSDPTAPTPLLARVSPEGTVRETIEPAVEGGRFPRALAVEDGRYYLAGVGATDELEIAPPGWLLVLDGFVEEPSYARQRGELGLDVEDVATAPAWDGPMVAGLGTGGSGAIADATADDLGWRHEIEDSMLTILPVGDGGAYLVGTGGDREEAHLRVLRVSAPLSADELAIDVGSESPSAGDTVSLAIDPGPYDPDLLDVIWTVDGAEVGTGPSIEATFEDSGERTIAAHVATIDDRTATVERTVSVTGSGSDSLPGFGLAAAGGGLAGAALLQRLRNNRDE